MHDNAYYIQDYLERNPILEDSGEDAPTLSQLGYAANLLAEMLVSGMFASEAELMELPEQLEDLWMSKK